MWPTIGSFIGSFCLDFLFTRQSRWKRAVAIVGPRLELTKRLPELPVHSREAVEQELKALDFLEDQVESAEKRLEAVMQVSAEADLLKTLPCVGKILSVVLLLEIGRVDRFPTAAHLASYPGSCPEFAPAVATRAWEKCAAT